MYIPDDDIVQLSSSIDRAFDIQEVYGLDLAQPSLCSRIESDSVHGQGMYMESPTVLRYGTFVEIMVPLFSMDFFKGNVTDTLSTSASGASWLQRCCLDLPPAAFIHPRTCQPPCKLQAVTLRMLLSHFHMSVCNVHWELTACRFTRICHCISQAETAHA